MKTTKTILIADPHQLFSAALAILVSGEGDLKVAGTYSCGQQAVDAAAAQQPDAMILATHLPDMDLDHALQQLRERTPNTGLLLLSSAPGAAELRRAIAGGADGYLRKSVSADMFLDAVRRIMAGFRVYDPSVVAAAIDTLSRSQTPSPRELMVLRLVAQGMTNNEVARRLRLAPGTVRNYVSSVITKTNARNRVDAVRIVKELALI